MLKTQSNQTLTLVKETGTSFDLSLHPNMQQIERMLHHALTALPNVTGLILHSDQGWQYQHHSFRNTLQKYGIIQSMSRKGNCYDNGIMESFFGRMKTRNVLWTQGCLSIV